MQDYYKNNAPENDYPQDPFKQYDNANKRAELYDVVTYSDFISLVTNDILFGSTDTSCFADYIARSITALLILITKEKKDGIYEQGELFSNTNLASNLDITFYTLTYLLKKYSEEKEALQ